jgi:hypothetical protein
VLPARDLTGHLDVSSSFGISLDSSKVSNLHLSIFRSFSPNNGYEEEYDRKSPTFCLDEKPVVLHADVQPPVPVEPGHPERVDYEYERRGTRNLFGLAAHGGDCTTHNGRLRQGRALVGG